MHVQDRDGETDLEEPRTVRDPDGQGTAAAGVFLSVDHLVVDEHFDLHLNFLSVKEG